MNPICSWVTWTWMLKVKTLCSYQEEVFFSDKMKSVYFFCGLKNHKSRIQ